MTKEEKERKDKIARKTKANEKMCYNCYYFKEEFTLYKGELRSKYAGFCTHHDDLGFNDEKSRPFVFAGDSVCEKWRRRFLDEGEKIIRENKISYKLENKIPICYTCKHYVEHRIPEQIAKHGEFTGDCWKRHKIKKHDDVCKEYESIFPI